MKMRSLIGLWYFSQVEGGIGYGQAVCRGRDRNTARYGVSLTGRKVISSP